MGLRHIPIYKFASDPTVNDDVDLEYEVSDHWLNTTSEEEFICADNTDGAAVWISLSSVLTSLPSKSGVIAAASFTGAPDRKATVTFATAFADANYSVSIISLGDMRVFTVESKAAGSFVVNAQAAQALTADVLWMATKHGES